MRQFSLCLFLLGLLNTQFIYAGHEDNISLREKIGQMLIMGFNGKQVDTDSPIVKMIEEDNIGGVILFDYNYQIGKFDKNIESPQQVRLLNSQLQEYNLLANFKYHRPNLPLLISVDYEGGYINRLKPKYGFPETLSAANVGKLAAKDASAAAHSMATTLKAAGFNLDFAPDLDVNVNPDNPIIGKKERSFSEDPKKVSEYGSIYTQGFLQDNVQCAYKHFPGHGSSTADSHLGFVDVSDTWQAYELEPFKQLLNQKNHCGMIMSAHIVNRQLDPSGLPASLSHKMLTELLRIQLKFDGVIITDDMQMKAIADNYSLEQALVMAINAGDDMFIFGNNLSKQAPQNAKEIIDIIEANVKAGKISPERIDNAYHHIVDFKKELLRNS